MSREIPILFSTEMVQAILEGRKSQTRRMVKPQPMYKIYRGEPAGLSWDNDPKVVLSRWFDEGAFMQELAQYCPYGKPGDRLWVREKWKPYSWNIDDNDVTILYATGEKATISVDGHGHDEWFAGLIESVQWELDKKGVEPTFTSEEDFHFTRDQIDKLSWRPSIHMPKAAARIWLEVEEVRVQRLQDIGHQDAVDEGILREWDGTKYWYQDYTKGAQGMVTVSQLSYKSLWESINGPDSWEQNPYVWVIKFRRV